MTRQAVNDALVTTFAVFCTVMILGAIAGAIIFGVVAGHKGFVDHRIRKDICVTLLQNNDYENYLIVCKSVDLIRVETNDELPVIIKVEEN